MITYESTLKSRGMIILYYFQESLISRFTYSTKVLRYIKTHTYLSDYFLLHNNV